MKVSLNWLREFVDFDLSPEETAKLLRSLGFDTASITRIGDEVSGVVTAKVEAREKHPNADKLSLCRVFDGKDHLRIVCGAPNVAAGQTVPLARLGAKLPGGVEIKPAKIRGEESQGMLCSTRELGLGEDHAGIFVLPEGTSLGEDVRKTLSLGDAVLDVEVMPNRPDMLSHWGVAREIAAALKEPLKLPDAAVPEAPKAALVSIEEKELCTRYVARAFEGVKVGPSPLWMRLRLERCGIRSINNLVDVTNYVLLELGHPLHVFDRALLAGGAVTVRLGRAGEKLACLDGQERSVENVLVVADSAKPQAAAGVMGGASSGVTEKTSSVLLEAAHFQASHVRASRRKLNLSSESSYRFERGTDRDVAAWASKRAAHLILALGGGRMAGLQEADGAVPKGVAVKVAPSRVESMLGFPLSADALQDFMRRLGFTVTSEGQTLSLTPPLHRHDVRDAADVAEEAGRLSGFDQVPARLRAAAQELEPPSNERRLLLAGRDLLIGQGFFEAQNTGLVSTAAWAALAGAAAERGVELDNPLSLSGELLAPSLLPGLLANVQLNRRRGAAHIRFFESARAFRNGPSGVTERVLLSFVADGAAAEEHWKFKPRPLTYWDAKSWVKSLLKAWRLPGVAFSSDGLPSFLHPIEAQTVRAGGETAGFFGRLHPRRAAEMDLSPDTFVAELDMTALGLVQPLPLRHGALSQHPALIRDFSLVFPDAVSWQSIALHVMKEAEHAENVELFDVYKGEGLPAGHRSLAFRVSFRHPERTLTDAEAAKIQEKVLADLKSSFGAALR